MMFKVMMVFVAVVPASVGVILRLHGVIGPQTFSAVGVSGFIAASTLASLHTRRTRASQHSASNVSLRRLRWREL
ncbi:MAG: hypothetical protein L0H78_16615 [Humibacillus sp.]|nr:hypothetical protein [Humibacillus sp.]